MLIIEVASDQNRSCSIEMVASTTSLFIIARNKQLRLLCSSVLIVNVNISYIREVNRTEPKTCSCAVVSDPQKLIVIYTALCIHALRDLFAVICLYPFAVIGTAKSPATTWKNPRRAVFTPTQSKCRKSYFEDMVPEVSCTLQSTKILEK